MPHRIIHRMKVTAILPDQMIKDLKAFAKVSTTTEALIVAVSDWLRAKKLKQLGEKVAKRPLKFQDGFDAAKVRALRTARQDRR